MFSNKKPVPSDVKKNIYIYDATGWQDAAFARTVLLLGPLDDEDRAFAVLRAVVADAAQERPARSHTAIRTSDGRVNVKIGGDGKQKIFLLRSLSSGQGIAFARSRWMLVLLVMKCNENE